MEEENTYSNIPEDLTQSRIDKRVVGVPERETRLRDVFNLPSSEKLLSDYGVGYLPPDGGEHISGTLVVTQLHLCFFIDLETIPLGKLMEGNIEVRKTNLFFKNSWDARWAVLQPDVFSLFESEQERFSLRDTVLLSDVHSVERVVEESTKKNAFQIVTSYSIHFLSCNTSEEADKWVQKIKLATKKFTKESAKETLRQMVPLRSILKVTDVSANHLLSGGICIETSNQNTYLFLSKRYKILQEQVKSLLQSLKPGEMKEDIFNDFELIEPQEMELDPISSQIDNTEFHKHFPHVPDNEFLIGGFVCCYVRKGFARPGFLYVTKSRLYYRSSLGFQSIQIDYSEIKEIRKDNAMYLLPVALTIKTKDQDLYFSNMPKRQQCYDLINECFSQFKLNPWKVVTTPNLENQHSFENVVEFNKKLRFTIMTVGTRGDVQPFIALAQTLEAKGHTVTIATHEAHRQFVESYNFKFFPLAGDPVELMKLCVNNDMFSVSFIREALSHYKQFIQDLLLSTWNACKKDTDVIIQNPPSMGGVHVAEKLKIPIFIAFTMPWSRTREFPSPFAVVEGAQLVPYYNYSTYVAIEQAMWLPLSDLFNEFRVSNLGLLPIHPFKGDGHCLPHKRVIPHVYCWSPMVLQKPSDWDKHIYISGYWFLDGKTNWNPPEKLVEFLSKEPKPIYIGFGSVTVPDPDGLTKVIIEALRRSKQRAVIVQGWGGIGKGAFDDVDFIYSIDKVPHDWLFQYVSAVIHHGGAGTVAAGLRAGVPTLIVPFFGDQYFWGMKLAELGAGLPYMTVKSMTVEKLANAIEKLVTDKDMALVAQNLGNHIRNQNGCEKAVDFIHKELSLVYNDSSIKESKDGFDFFIENDSDFVLKRLNWDLSSQMKWKELPPEKIETNTIGLIASAVDLTVFKWNPSKSASVTYSPLFKDEKGNEYINTKYNIVFSWNLKGGSSISRNVPREISCNETVENGTKKYTISAKKEDLHIDNIEKNEHTLEKINELIVEKQLSVLSSHSRSVALDIVNNTPYVLKLDIFYAHSKFSQLPKDCIKENEVFKFGSYSDTYSGTYGNLRYKVMNGDKSVDELVFSWSNPYIGFYKTAKASSENKDSACWVETLTKMENSVWVVSFIVKVKENV